MAYTSAKASCTDQQPTIDQEPLKRRKGLSKYYVSKSQSFNCMEDLLRDTAFGKSSLLLAKRGGVVKQSQQTFNSFKRRQKEPQQHLWQDAFMPCSLQRRSWDGDDSKCSFSVPEEGCCYCTIDVSSTDCSCRQIGYPKQQELHHHGSAAAAAVDQSHRPQPWWAGDGTEGLCSALQDTSLATSSRASSMGYPEVGHANLVMVGAAGAY